MTNGLEIPFVNWPKPYVVDCGRVLCTGFVCDFITKNFRRVNYQSSF